jgi:hypothetical protein
MQQTRVSHCKALFFGPTPLLADLDIGERGKLIASRSPLRFELTPRLLAGRRLPERGYHLLGRFARVQSILWRPRAIGDAG